MNESTQATSKSYQIGEVTFTPAEKLLVFSRYRSVKLSARETLVLQYLLDNANQAITLTEIISKCLHDYPCDPIATRKTIQQLSFKLELADHIEYPYIDCYLFRYNAEAQTNQKQGLFNFKKLTKLLQRAPLFTRSVNAH